MGWLKDKVLQWLDIQSAAPLSVVIQEALTHELNVFRNRLWYRGDPTELHQFYTATDDSMHNTSFWAATASTGVHFRKIHSGLPSLIVDVLCDLVLTDLNGIKVNATEAQERWDKIAEDNDFPAVLKSALRETLVEGDGAFKISYDESISDFPIIEFLAGERVKYDYQRQRLESIHFLTKAQNPDNPTKRWILEEVYAKDGVAYNLYDARGRDAELSEVAEFADLTPITNSNEFILAVQFMIDESPKWEGRGKSLFDNKVGTFDALDECVSQWVEAMRDGRTTKYIPEVLLPKNPNTGKMLRPNAFDNRFVATGADMREQGNNQIEVKSGEIPHDALLASYTTLLDLCIQGIISPSTLGIDMKKLDNAEAQREKEKATLYTRNKIIDKLEKAIPLLVETVLKTDDMLHDRTPGDYEVSVSFGEYANPSFEAQVETVGKARQYGIISTERAVEELYGDSLTDKDKAEEVSRIKAEQGAIDLPLADVSAELDTPVVQLHEGD